jgi:hypothetical protein
MTNTATQTTGIEISAKVSIFFILYFLFFKPQIEVDGSAAVSGKWNGSTFVAAAPGEHQVAVYYKAYFILPVNRAAMPVTVVDGGVARIEYKPSIWGMLGKGKIAAA